ncbi:uncharacterized protein MAM_04678 [Metarhizium album ARSEF 1941]|uniref:Uncharacterized protein n=1 Tax=Metarhizium album (strain ARSEF 1941) TaxID=1081103 RepID=A0A0B2WUC5_METAS|nr:uncharacterized protein MAM_04678 [Metarhizium album ARSEF 1941]KHN97663.1 hypothetical protein MAM_04678 [Metarhizium album ARSEF 1941]
MDVGDDKRLATMDVLSLISSPSYAPTTLRHLPQPVPNHLPPGVDGSIFTFEDAFEDLLAVSKGQKLPDITTRYEQRRLLRDMFPSGEPTWFWLRRLEAQGLVQVPSRAHFFGAHHPDWSSFHKELDRHAADAWRSLSKGHGHDACGSGDFFEEIGKAFKQLERGFSGRGNRNSDANCWERKELDRGPDTFEELFSEISSKFKESASSWDTFVKNISVYSKPKSQQGKPEAQVDGHEKGKVVTDENEYVDRFGYLHKTVTRKTLDADGNEVGSETYVIVRPADKHLDNENNPKIGGNEPLEIGTDTKKSSWFWK